MILILGKGHLASALQSRFGTSNCIMVGRPEFDFANQEDCDRLLEQYPAPPIVINTTGVVSNDHWENLTVNFVAPAYLTLQYVAKTTNCQIINISSASAWWVSYPDLALDRFSYNIAKESLSNFGQHINRIIVNQDRNVVVTTIEPGKFQSAMSNYTGQDIARIVDSVEYAVQTRPQQLSVIK
jgi:NAD(P)-dependent dehydrogenase (short-subunit alcohol dehydrogenase family)